MIDLNFMEGVVAHASRMNNESSLGNTSDIFLVHILLVVLIVILHVWKHWVWLANYLQRL